MTEEWRDIPGYEGYQASNLGNIRGLNHRPYIHTNQNGYVQAVLRFPGQIKRDRFGYVHRLVAMAWIPNDDPEHKTEVHHKDYNKHNNRVDNLSWVTLSENRIHWKTHHGPWAKPLTDGEKRMLIELYKRERSIKTVWELSGIARDRIRKLIGEAKANGELD